MSMPSKADIAAAKDVYDSGDKPTIFQHAVAGWDHPYECLCHLCIISWVTLLTMEQLADEETGPFTLAEFKAIYEEVTGIPLPKIKVMEVTDEVRPSGRTNRNGYTH